MTSETPFLPADYCEIVCREIRKHDFVETFRLHNLFCDFVIKAGNERYNCHKLVLAATVPYFETMLSSAFLETSTGEVEFPEHMSDSLDIVIKYIYTGSIKISVSNVLAVLRIGTYLGINDLVGDCNDFINRNYDLISETDGFLTLEWIELLRIIECDHQQANEKFIWETVMKWMKHEPESRISTLPKLMEGVRFDLINPTYIWRNIAKDDLLTSSKQCKDFMYEVLGNLVTELDVNGVNPNMNRCVVGEVYVLGGICNGSSTDNVLKFDSQLVEWRNINPMNAKMKSFGATVLKRKIYTAGGSSSTNEFYMFDTVYKKWSKLDNLNEGRYGLGVCNVSNNIYACGGKGSNNMPLNSVERYDSHKDRWVTATPMNETRGYVKVVDMMGSLWAIGGEYIHRTYIDISKTLSSVERFDPREGCWSQCTPMLEERKNHGAAVLQGKIYVCGGQSIEVYDPRNTKWRLLSPMSHYRSDPSLVAYGGMIWAIGGYNETVEIYDKRINEWTLGTPLPWSLNEHSAVSVPH